MSELTNVQRGQEGLRRALLTNASLLALLGSAWISPALASENDDRPTVWVELGGQLERVDSAQTIFAPSFFDITPPEERDAMIRAQRPSRYSVGGEGKISLMPAGTDWVLSAAVRYGRTGNARHLHQETPGLPTITDETVGLAPLQPHTPVYRVFGDGQTKFAESHFIMDFQAGKDVGLGMFGSTANSVISAGVRIAQFTSSSDVTLHARPVYNLGPLDTNPKYKFHSRYFQTYTAVLHARRSTHAIGPSIAWNASVPVAGRTEGAMLALDLGVNASVLFGRQRASTDHQTSGYNKHYIGLKYRHHSSYAAHPPARTVSRSVTIPNVGGFAGLSLKFPNAKVSLGYRADLFFDAMDSGIDARNTADRNFFGPYATLSIGLP